MNSSELPSFASKSLATFARTPAKNSAAFGTLTVMSRHTTARLTINEREPELQRDMVSFLTSLVPADLEYRHNRHTVDGRANAHAHVLGLFVNASETIPITDGALELGAWQSIFFVELDGPRATREVQLQVIGERGADLA